MALSHIGARDNIPSLSENSIESRQCNLWVDISRRQTLEAYNWNFARKRVALVKEDLLSLYESDFTSTDEWYKGFNSFDGVVSAVAGSLTYTVGAGDGTIPRIVRALIVDVGRSYTVTMSAPTGTATTKQTYLSTLGNGGFDGAITPLAVNAELSATVIPTQSIIYLVARANAPSVGETFALSSVSVVPTDGLAGAAPEGVWGWRFYLPDDYLKVRELQNPGVPYTPYGHEGWGAYAQPDAVPFTIELSLDGTYKTLLTDLEEPTLLYTANVTDLTMFSPTAIIALSYCLAHNICYKITGKMQLADRMIQLFSNYIRTAAMQDGNEQVERAPRDAPSIRGRW